MGIMGTADPVTLTVRALDRSLRALGFFVAAEFDPDDWPALYAQVTDSPLAFELDRRVCKFNRDDGIGITVSAPDGRLVLTQFIRRIAIGGIGDWAELIRSGFGNRRPICPSEIDNEFSAGPGTYALAGGLMSNDSCPKGISQITSFLIIAAALRQWGDVNGIITFCETAGISAQTARSRCLPCRQVISTEFLDASGREPFPLWMNSQSIDEFRHRASGVWSSVNQHLEITAKQQNTIGALALAVRKGYSDQLEQSRPAA